MIEFTSEAKQRREEYLRQVRTCVGASATADPEEVLREVREHIERELQEAAQPVSEADLEAVLSRLGRPEQWVPEEDLPWWRRMALRFQTGPEDWRLAYLSLGVLTLGMLLAGAFGRLAAPFAILGSFCLSRAALAAAGDARALGERKWLVYPSLVLVYVPLAVVLLLWPALRLGEGFRSFGVPSITVFVGTAIWWGFLWILAKRYPRLPEAVFRPFVGPSAVRALGWMAVAAAAVTTLLTVYGVLIATGRVD
jgi:hypothetical protein